MVHNITSKWNAFRNSAAKLQQFGDIREVLITSYCITAKKQTIITYVGLSLLGFD